MSDVVPLLRLWAEHLDAGDEHPVDLTDDEVTDALIATIRDAADEIDRLRDLGLRLYVALRDYPTTDPAEIAALLAEVKDGAP